MLIGSVSKICFGTQNDVVAVCGKREANRMAKLFGGTQAYWVIDQQPEWIIDAILGATAYIGLDSGMSHLAALLGVRTVSIHAHFRPDFLWFNNSVRSVVPRAPCVFCHFRTDRGWTHSCSRACSALALVSPEAVLEAALGSRVPFGEAGAVLRPNTGNVCQL